ncbi:hypothetical protein P170DRAFT_496245 [Aspergillus steynii IBT 23096]|uniref:Protein kinase domain-containing protein n=1 Tax=Aspergillus steynii IBT 23096 TaxID=1392250 RepID=A0A2I2G3T0_9EURO|nr:uncharacterized protein P170DRAFT_496245 [Aspergillus steynii IBT 23096]PLB47527.1 hypothetical protein P170DRAFT_496245 [Aspergillus steynii IBT 23096]
MIMRLLTIPFRWQVWPSLWSFFANLVGGVHLFQFQLGETALDKDVESAGPPTPHVQHNAIEQSDETIVHVKYPPNCIAFGFSETICKVDEDTVVKHPQVIPDNDPYNLMFRDMIMNEALIYERLGNHQGVVPYLGVHDEAIGAIRLAYAKEGDLEHYIQSHDKPSETIRAMWIPSLLETFRYIYSRKVLHQDVKPNNILVDNGSLKAVDFANSAMWALDADMEDVCREDPLSRVDILGLGYDRWPQPDDLPPTSGLLYGDIIKKCWSDSYGTIKELYEGFIDLSGEGESMSSSSSWAIS